LDSIHDEGVATPRLRPATAAGQPPRHAAGPFEVAPAEERNGGFGSVLVTGLLVIYPAFATVAAIVVGLSLSSGGA
jgi:hypothetical protein